MIKERRNCVFCGKNAVDKNREHIIPLWLIELTGNPNRRVRFGTDYSNNRKPIEFDWSSFVVPACKKCNSDFSDLESKVKPIILSLQKRNAILLSDYSILMDWLDKVRIGVWIAIQLLEKHPLKIVPNFYIKQRISSKDRLLSVYPLDTQEIGMNIFGVNTMIFASMPSCFTLKINNIVLLSASTDFLCSQNCGLPYPRKIEYISDNDNGNISLKYFDITRKIYSPILDFKFNKSCVLLYQPIRFPTKDKVFQGKFIGDFTLTDTFILKYTIPPSNQKGVFFRQYDSKVVPIFDQSSLVEFDEVLYEDSSSVAEIIANGFELQRYIFEHKYIKNLNLVDNFDSLNNKIYDTKIFENEIMVEYYKQLGKS